ncbi:hypothetical protein [Treponema endosymbiont of Eucomonympha sp.]|uniref:hypothetical protein n=1 Tax=Treponema endosymbiont of Eucomonympha sp. TaxID=1580831 RepID=UPI0007864123|nr:hypothetical protein [Treponema endosymbiont of Eucomonympha sp.]
MSLLTGSRVLRNDGTLPAALRGIASSAAYPTGEMHECRLREENVISTPCGEVVPQYSAPDARQKELKSLSFYRSGKARSVCLDRQTEVRTPLGALPAELLVFYENGSLDSVFPLNGQLGFGWSEEEEGQLAPYRDFSFPFGQFRVKVNGVRFYESGAVKSVIFWPGETVSLNTPAGTFPARIGIRLYEDGALHSFEPAVPIELDTPIGQALAYDVNAVGVEADRNSVSFDRGGKLAGFASSGDLVVNSPRQGRVRLSSLTRLGLSDDVLVKNPLVFSFEGDAVSVSDGKSASSFDLRECKFLLLPDIDPGAGLGCGGRCGSAGSGGCSGCE